MTSTRSGSVRLVDEICDEFLNCGICNSRYTTPRSLHCQHTFCEECLEIRYAIEEQERPHRFLLSRSLSCPLCLAKTDLPPGGVRRLPLNTVVTKLADVVRRPKLSSERQSCEICHQSSNQRKVAASVKCLECCKNLCTNCATMHQQMKVTQDHSLFSVEAENDMECRSHSGEPVRFYCEQCKSCICILCTFQDHSDHSILSFHEALQRYTHSATVSLQSCRQLAARIRHSLDVIKRAELGLRQAEERIRDVTIETVTSVRQKERQLMAELRCIYGEEEMKFMTKGSSDLLERLRSIERTTELVEALLMNGRTAEFLIMRNELNEKLESLQNTGLQGTPSSLSQYVKFVPCEPGSSERLGRLCLLSTGSDETTESSDDDCRDQSDLESVSSTCLSARGLDVAAAERCDTGYGTETFSDSLASSDCPDSHYADSITSELPTLDNVSADPASPRCHADAAPAAGIELPADAVRSNTLAVKTASNNLPRLSSQTEAFSSAERGVNVTIQENRQSSDRTFAESVNLVRDTMNGRGYENIDSTSKSILLESRDNTDFLSTDVSNVRGGGVSRPSYTRVTSPRASSYSSIRYRVLGESAAPPPPIMVRRRTQTDKVLTTDSYTEPMPQLTYTQQTNTETVDTADRSTLTMYQTTCERATSSDGLVTCRDQESHTVSPVAVNASTLTERVRQRPAATQAGGQDEQSTKGTMTRKALTLERETNTPVVATYDCEVTAFVRGEDKASNTKTIVTMDVGSGGNSPLNLDKFCDNVDVINLAEVSSVNRLSSQSVKNNPSVGDELSNSELSTAISGANTFKVLNYCDSIEDSTMLNYMKKRFKQFHIINDNTFKSLTLQNSNSEIAREFALSEKSKQFETPSVHSTESKNIVCTDIPESLSLKSSEMPEEITERNFIFAKNERCANFVAAGICCAKPVELKNVGDVSINKETAVDATGYKVSEFKDNNDAFESASLPAGVSEIRRRSETDSHQITSGNNNWNNISDICSETNISSLTKSTSSSVFSSFPPSGPTSPSTSTFASCMSSNSDLASLSEHLENDQMIQENLTNSLESADDILDLPFQGNDSERFRQLVLPHTQAVEEQARAIHQDNCQDQPSLHPIHNLIDRSRDSTISQEPDTPLTFNESLARDQLSSAYVNRIPVQQCHTTGSSTSHSTATERASDTDGGCMQTAGPRYDPHQLVKLLEDLVCITDMLKKGRNLTAESEQLIKKICFTVTEALQMSKSFSSHYSVSRDSIRHETQESVDSFRSGAQLCVPDNDSSVNHDSAQPVCTRTVSDASTDYDRVPLTHQSSNTEQLFRVDVGIETRPIVLVDSATSTLRLSMLSKETSTPIIHRIHKNVGTLESVMVDTGTSMTANVAAAYIQEATARRAAPAMVSRGTCTVFPPRRDEHTGVRPEDLEGRCERGTSPVRPLLVDKAVMVNKASALEPVDKYQAAGKQRIAKLLRPFVDGDKRLDCISESLAEECEEEEDGFEESSDSALCIESSRVTRASENVTSRTLSVTHRQLDRYKLALPSSPRPIKPPPGSETRFSFDGMPAMLSHSRNKRTISSLPSLRSVALAESQSETLSEAEDE